MSESKYAKYVISEPHTPDEIAPEDVEKMSVWNRLILAVNDRIVPGAFHMNCCWYMQIPTEQEEFSHKHDVPEIIGFIGSDPQNPGDLGGEIEWWMEDEKFILTRSTMIFAPAGLRHCPLIIHRLDRPVFHFTVVTSPSYSQSK